MRGFTRRISSLCPVKVLMVFTRFRRDEISSRDEFIPVFRTGMRFHPGMKFNFFSSARGSLQKVRTLSIIFFILTQNGVFYIFHVTLIHQLSPKNVYFNLSYTNRRKRYFIPGWNLCVNVICFVPGWDLRVKPFLLEKIIDMIYKEWASRFEVYKKTGFYVI